MTNKEKIKQYVIETSKLYSLDYQNYFFKHDPDVDFEDLDADMHGEIKIFDDSKDYDWNIHRISEFLGISEYDVKHTRKKAKFALWEKYNCFELYTMYKKHKVKAMYKYEDYEELSAENIMFTLFDVPLYKKKYDFKDIYNRLIESLKESDKYIPGTFHKDSTIENLEIEVEQFYDFPNIKDLLKSFFELYDRMSELFFKGLTQDLNQDEINEYNLAVSFFHAREACGVQLLYYSILKENRMLYINEGYSQIQSYLNIPDYMDFKPWKCKQIVADKELLQKYQDIFPQTKDKIRKFCMNIKNFTCFFVWSDELERVRNINEALPQDIISAEEDDVPQYEIFYVKKSSEEIGDDYTLAQELSKMTYPPSQGGLVKKTLEYNRYSMDHLKRINARYKFHKNSNLIENTKEGDDLNG